MKIILASASPRRKALLSTVFSNFEVEFADTKENLYGSPSQAVIRCARNKARAIHSSYDLLIAADTIVYFNKKYMCKPKSYEEATLMLTELSAKVHKVYTGVCIIYKGQEFAFYDISTVLFENLSEKFIDNYVKKGLAYDKAGGYGIQDGFVKEYSGSYNNILGLPTEKLKEFLITHGIKHLANKN